MEIQGSDSGVPDAFGVAVQRKVLDQQRMQGAQAMRLIESAQVPQNATPGPDSTVHVIA